MSEPRKTADTITDDVLDQLYAIVEQADETIAANKRLSECRTRAVGQRAEQAEAERDGAYRERAHLVALLAAMTDGAVITPALDLDEPGWWITYLNIGGQQASWHISPRDAGLFRDVERVEPDDPRAQWDGHTTDEKYAGIAAWTTAMAQTRGPIASPLRAQCEATVRMILAGTGAHTVDEWAEYVTAAILPIFRTHIDELRRERDQAIAHDRQPYPTAWAYEQACEALHAHRDRADQAEAAIKRVRVLIAGRWGSVDPDRVRAALDEQPGSAATEATQPDDSRRQEAIRQLDADPHGLTAGMIVKPYTEYGQQKWVFRCWGTDDGCDGSLSLDHTTESSAQSARDRHVREEHPTKEQPVPTTPCTATIEGVNVPDDEVLTCTVEDVGRHPANHVGPKRAYGQVLWTDHHAGATPHQASGEQS